MAYKKQNFVDGMPLSAAQLNHMEDGIVELEKMIPDAEPESENGGYYIPSVSQPSSATMAIDFTPSKSGMPEIQSVQVTLPPGPEGKKPEKGVDYWTDSDKESIIQEVIAALGTPVFGTVDENNNIVLTGELAEGTYTLKYEDGEGNVTTIGTLSHGDNDPTYTNLAEPTSADWVVNSRLNSSGAIAAASVYGNGGAITNFIPCKASDVIRVKGLDISHYYVNQNGETGRTTAYFYADDKSTIIAKNIPADGNGWVYSNDVWTYTVGDSLTAVSGDSSAIGYARLTGIYYDGCTANDVIITVNEEIA